jgi:CRP-like cAMP-binding protein
MSEIILTDGTKKLGAYLLCSSAALQNVVKQQGQMLKQGRKPKPIGELLLDTGVITREELDTAIRKQRVDRLRRSPVFHMLSDAELAAISTRFTEVSVDPGKQFIFQDEPDPTLYILASGRVEVYRTTLEGQHIHIAYVDPPEPIGEMGYFQGGIRNASVRAVDAVELLQADYSKLTHYFEYVPRVAHEFMKIVEQRRYATAQIIQKQAG